MATRPERDAVADVAAAGSSVVGVEGALRARDVSRPDPADFEAADQLPVRRTSWRPPAGSLRDAQGPPSQRRRRR